jgi:hypothetical protein
VRLFCDLAHPLCGPIPVAPIYSGRISANKSMEVQKSIILARGDIEFPGRAFFGVGVGSTVFSMPLASRETLAHVAMTLPAAY